ncbi:ABC transporter ATP-binding protein [bacterium]|nr:MAG: ABC transporter ATP-binding protein [bacterium]
MSAAIRFEDVTKRFALARGRARSWKEAFVGAVRRAPRDDDELLALDGVSFELARGDSLGLVGPNGTGKSTVLKLVARILEPSAGRVVIDGRVAALLELGAGFHPDLTGRENVYLNGSMLGFTQREMEARIGRIVDFSELGRFVDMPVKHYSSGMYMRLGFATAIHLDAEILLIDEVLAVGDQAFQYKCRDRIAELRRDGVSIVLVSHDNHAIRELCHHALWLERGKVRAYGETDGVVEAYHASMVAREEARLAAEAAEHAAEGDADGAVDRWGTGDVDITGVEFLGPDGTPHHVLHTGAPATIRVRYAARGRVERPVFGLGIHRIDGVHVTGPNTRLGGLDIPFVEGAGAIDYHLAALPLIAGTYEISVSCYDDTLSHAFDYHHRRFPIHVRGSAGAEALGVVVLAGRWAHHAAPEGREGAG